jgi:hypothetical protein
MTRKTVTIEHTGHSCVCDRCFGDYFDWFMDNLDRFYPRRRGEPVPKEAAA